ncbi:MAG: sulfotransferase, partial [Nevskia sp.]|nr:sulfotransferase [Nevskia sp.]
MQLPEAAEPAIAALRANLRGGRLPADALAEILPDLRQRPLESWLAVASWLQVAGIPAAAAELLEAARPRWPHDVRLLYLLGSALRACRMPRRAEELFRQVLAQQPDHEFASISLSLCLRDGGRLRAAAAAVRAPERLPAPEDVLRRVGILFDCRDYAAVEVLCARALDAGHPPALPHLHAGRAAHAQGRFDAAREHLLASLGAGLDLAEWGGILLFLAGAQKYTDASHPDLVRFRSALDESALAPHARCAAAFALGKALDDLGDFGGAAASFRMANGWAAAQRPWSGDGWRALMRQRLAANVPSPARAPSAAVLPVFVVGLPRTGTTLVADLLGRHPAVRNRGETAWIPYIARQLGKRAERSDAATLREAGELYRRQIRQDDAPAACYIDKNPLNFRYLGLIARMLPEARVVHCVRAPGDTALSIWSQYFEDRDCDFAYGFDSIAAVMQGEAALLRHFTALGVLPVHTVEYESLVTDPAAALAGLGA